MTLKLIWIGVALRVLVAFWNAYFGPSFGAGGDAADFHIVAVEFSRDLHTDRFHAGVLFSYILGTIYYFSTSSLFFGGLLSVGAWFVSARVLVWIMHQLLFEPRQQAAVMLVYALWPSSILWTGVTLREPYQLLVVNLAMYAALRIYVRGFHQYWLALGTATVVGGLLQPALLVFGVVLLAITTLWLLLRRREHITVSRVLWVVPLAVAILVYGYYVLGSVYFSQLKDSLAGAIESYQRGGLSLPARTHYKESVSIDGWVGLLLFAPTALFQYLFEPMPWRISSIVDVPPLLENVLRGFLLWCAVRAPWRLPVVRRRALLLLLLGYLSLETVFAMGTVNWGTSSRHHIPSMGLLAVCAAAGLKRRRGAVIAPESIPQRVHATA